MGRAKKANDVVGNGSVDVDSSPDSAVRSRNPGASSSKSPKASSARGKKSSAKRSNRNEAKAARESTVKFVCVSLLFAILAVAGSIVVFKGVSLHEDYMAARLAASKEAAAAAEAAAGNASEPSGDSVEIKASKSWSDSSGDAGGDAQNIEPNNKEQQTAQEPNAEVQNPQEQTAEENNAQEQNVPEHNSQETIAKEYQTETVSKRKETVQTSDIPNKESSSKRVEKEDKNLDPSSIMIDNEKHENVLSSESNLIREGDSNRPVAEEDGAGNEMYEESIKADSHDDDAEDDDLDESQDKLDLSRRENKLEPENREETREGEAPHQMFEDSGSETSREPFEENEGIAGKGVETLTERLDEKESPEREKAEIEVAKPSQKLTKDFNEVTSDSKSESESLTPFNERGSSLDESAAREETEDEYFRKVTTNTGDFAFRKVLDDLEDKLFQSQTDPEALTSVTNEFIQLLEAYPQSPRAMWGVARCLDAKADLQKSNSILEEAILFYERVIDSPETPDALALLAGKRLVNRLQFRGRVGSAIKAQKRLILSFSDDASLQTDLGILYELSGHREESRPIFEKVLEKEPQNALASVYLGYILKTIDGNNRKSIELLDRGIKSEVAGTQEARFYSALGDALVRVGRRKDADAIYADGVNLGFFLDKYRRPLYKERVVPSQAWWTPEESGADDLISALVDKWKIILSEARKISQMDQFFSVVMETLTMTGGVEEFPLYFRGQEAGNNCYYAPETCATLRRFPSVVNCVRCQIKFQILFPNTYLWPHCGPTNGRLKIQLGLKVPAEPDTREEIRVGLPDSGAASWQEGAVLVFDDSFEQEVWISNPGVKGAEPGAVKRDVANAVFLLSVDVWHPILDSTSRVNLGPLPF